MKVPTIHERLFAPSVGKVRALQKYKSGEYCISLDSRLSDGKI